MGDFQIDLTPALQQAVAIIRTRIDLQVPVRTGELKNSVKVYAQNNEVYIQYDDYGVFTNYGTGPYYNGRYGQAQIPGTFRGYQKGVGGIQAQNWTSISLDEDIRITDIIETEAVNQTVEVITQGLIDL
jgi:hypothetical protein